MKRIAFYPGIGSFTISLLLAGLVGLAFSTPAQAGKKDVAELRFGRISPDPKSPIPGEGFKLNVTMWNKGKGNAVRFRVDAVSRGKSLGKAVFPELKAGGRATRAIALTYPGNPGAAPKRFCVDLLINRLKNVNAEMDKAEVCVSAKTVAKSSKKPEKPSARPSEKTASERSSSREETPRARAALPAPGRPVAPEEPIKIEIASLDIRGKKLALELENKHRELGLRNPLVEVWHVQAGEKKRIFQNRLTSIPAYGSRLLRIEMPKGAKATDYLEVRVNKKLIGRKGLKGVLDEDLAQVPAAKKLGKGKLGKKGKPFKLPANLQPLGLHMPLRVNDEPMEVAVGEGETARVTWDLPAAPGPTGAMADGINLRINNGPFPTPCSNDVATFGDFSNPDSGYRSGGSYPLTLTDDRYRVGNTYYVMGCFWNRDTGYTDDWTNTVAVRYGSFVTIGDPVFYAEPAGIVPVPDLIVSEIQMSEEPSEMGRILVRFKDANRTRPFRQWYESFARSRRDAGLASDMESIYPFEYIIFVDGRRIPGPARRSYLPPSGRKHVLDYNHSLPADGRLHRVEVRVTPIGRPDQRSDNNSLVRELRVEPVRIRITISGLNEMEVLYDGDSGGAGELLTLRSELGAVGSSGRLVSWGREGEDVERDVRVAEARRGEIRNITSAALYSGSLPDYRIIHDGDHLRVDFGGVVAIETTTDKVVRMNFDALEDDCPGWAPCTIWGHYRIDVPIRSLWPMLDRCITGVNALNLADMPRSRFVLSSDDHPGGPSIRPISGQVCVTRIP